MDAFSRKKERLTLNTQELNLQGSKKKSLSIVRDMQIVLLGK